jgi:hypothetical protein
MTRNKLEAFSHDLEINYEKGVRYKENLKNVRENNSNLFPQNVSKFYEFSRI